MRVGSVFAGIGGFDLAFERAGAEVIFTAEIDAKCRSVLRHHWPGTPRFKDVKTVTGSGLGAAGLRPDCLVGGFPCQDLSVAGARAGLAGERSGLFFEFARVLAEAQPRWFLLENVPGLLSSAGGRDFGVLLSTLVNLGYGVAWRVLDAQYFGVAQRRRRVFIVGCAGDGDRAREVLLVGEGGGGDPPARRAPWSVPAALTANGVGTCGADDNQAQAGHFVPAVSNALVAPSTGGHHYDPNGEALVPVAFHLQQDPISGPISPALPEGGTGCATTGVAYRKATKIHGPLASAPDAERWEEAVVTDTFTERDGTAPTTLMVSPVHVDELDRVPAGVVRDRVHVRGEVAGNERGAESVESGTDGGENGVGVKVGVDGGGDRVGRHLRDDDSRPSEVNGNLLAVRRLTPLECLRLQGFPDGWLDGLGLADSVKYRMIGNAVAVPVVEWIARRMMEADRG